MGKSSTKQEQLEWRRNKVFELSIKGFSQSDISRMLNIPRTNISRDIDYLKQSAKQEIKKHITDRLPYEYNKCLSGLEEIIKESWIIAAKADKTDDSREKLSSLALIKDCYSTKMELLTNANLLSDSIKFVETKKQKLSNDKEKEEVNNQNNDIQGSIENNRPAESAVF